jgi:hypothetical protein
VIGVFGLVALAGGAHALWRRRRYGVALVVLGVVLVALEVYARVRPAAPAVTELRLSREEQVSLQVQLAQTELRAAGFAVPRTGDSGSGVTAVDGDFTAQLTPTGDKFRLERTGHAPLEGVTLPEAVAKILEAHTPKP